MKITIFGTGYVGLVTGACLAEVGHEVLCMDIDQTKINRLKDGVIPIFEPGLDSLIQTNYKNGNLGFTISTEQAVNYGDLLLITVGTPPDENGSADLNHVLTVAANIGKYLKKTATIITKSTVPVGTSDKVYAVITNELQNRSCDIPVVVASNPEFLKEGDAVADFMKPDRIIVGTDSEQAKSRLRELYAPFNRSSDRMLYMDIRSAELTKYAANAMLATKISFMNEIANLSEKLGVDVEQVRRGIGSDPRIGHHFIYPGAGYGGSCFPKDVRALGKTAEENNIQLRVLAAVESANEHQKIRLFNFINQKFKGHIKGKTFAIWGLAFKPKTDDMREASSRVLMEALWEAGANVTAYDPEAMDETRRLYPDQPRLKLVDSQEQALQSADALVICTEWQHFRAPNFEQMKSLLKEPLIFDGRNLYDPAQMASLGFSYYGIGRGDSLTRT